MRLLGLAVHGRRFGDREAERFEGQFSRSIRAGRVRRLIDGEREGHRVLHPALVFSGARADRVEHALTRGGREHLEAAADGRHAIEERAIVHRLEPIEERVDEPRMRLEERPLPSCARAVATVPRGRYSGAEIARRRPWP